MPDSPRRLDSAPHHAWLIDRGLAGAPVSELLDGFCERLGAAGIPVTRGFLSFATLHPLLWATGFLWQRGKAVEPADVEHGFESGAAWLSSPFRHMLESGTRRLRRPLAGANALLDYPVLGELRDQGLTDWLALFFSFGWRVEHSQLSELGVIFSWATDRSGGWTERELAALEELSGTLALAVRSGSAQETTRTLLATYLGRDAAERVVVGQIQRGSVERSTAIILDADLRGFTDFAEAAVPEEVTRRLNGFFDCVGAPVKDAGGEILKFLGDGLLAVFLAEAERDMASVAEATLAAAREILARVGALNDTEQAAGNPTLVVDIALHAGEVTYGNVGTAERLDFTVIGPAVNEVSRLEGLCKELDRQLLVSDSLVRAAPALRGRLRSLGRYRLRGVSEAREVYGLDQT
ncbi:MAG: adenylate/guanylate cyclase domain-containing protein [Kiloniellales bacterium]